jgi:hypothetical protein
MQGPTCHAESSIYSVDKQNGEVYGKRGMYSNLSFGIIPYVGLV